MQSATLKGRTESSWHNNNNNNNNNNNKEAEKILKYKDLIIEI
jgi:hypothetical protein